MDISKIPRIRGKVGQAEPGQGYDGKWFFHIEIATFYGETIGEPVGPFGPFDTKEIAQAELKEAARISCEHFEKQHNGKASGQYMDMKNGGILRPWKEHS